jgi:hypothetical protein
MPIGVNRQLTPILFFCALFAQYRGRLSFIAIPGLPYRAGLFIACNKPVARDVFLMQNHQNGKFSGKCDGFFGRLALVDCVAGCRVDIWHQGAAQHGLRSGWIADEGV